jgi:2,3-bisphosphoglycerate-independent phosphoglycerate mutase
MNSVLLIFIDGVGIGKEDYEFNPFFKYNFKTFTNIFGKIPSLKNQVLIKDDIFLFPSDARLGIDGLPQSGTGQTSIFCGVNAAKIIGKHFGPYPYSTLIPIISEKNIFKYYLSKNKKTFFANAYPKVFFDYIKSGKSRFSVTTLSCKMNGMRFNTVTNVRKGKALTAEITNERWNTKLEYNLPIIKPKTAANRLLKIASQNSFTAYEYFLTDHIGHGRYDGEIDKTINIIDEFLYSIITELDKKNLTLVICSDHGNFEDLSIKTHTLNPSITITAGKHAESLFDEIKNISQIKPAIIKYCG